MQKISLTIYHPTSSDVSDVVELFARSVADGKTPIVRSDVQVHVVGLAESPDSELVLCVERSPF